MKTKMITAAETVREARLMKATRGGRRGDAGMGATTSRPVMTMTGAIQKNIAK